MLSPMSAAARRDMDVNIAVAADAVAAADAVVAAADQASKVPGSLARRSKPFAWTISMRALPAVYPSTWPVVATVAGEGHRRSRRAERSARGRHGSPTK